MAQHDWQTAEIKTTAPVMTQVRPVACKVCGIAFDKLQGLQAATCPGPDHKCQPSPMPTRRGLCMFCGEKC